MEAKVETTLGQLPKSSLWCEFMGVAFAKKDVNISLGFEYTPFYQVYYQVVCGCGIIWEDCRPRKRELIAL